MTSNRHVLMNNVSTHLEEIPWALGHHKETERAEEDGDGADQDEDAPTAEAVALRQGYPQIWLKQWYYNVTPRTLHPLTLPPPPTPRYTPYSPTVITQDEATPGGGNVHRLFRMHACMHATVRGLSPGCGANSKE